MMPPDDEASSAASWQPGAQIGGYLLEELLARGGMGKVYRAIQLALDRQVVVKVLDPGYPVGDAEVQAFLSEMRNLARLEQPSIIPIFDAGYAQERYFLVTAWFSGRDLDRVVVEDGPLPEAAALQTALQTARALAYAWETHRILHLDVKPGNIMANDAGEVRLLDFGVAYRFGEQSALHSNENYCGTPDYSSPEQIYADKEMDQRADIYALGATLYYLLSGRAPYAGHSQEAVLHKEQLGPPPLLHTLRSEINRGTSRLVNRMLAADPDQRPEDWTVLQASLSSLLHELRQADKMRVRVKSSGGSDTVVKLPASPRPARPQTGLPKKVRNSSSSSSPRKRKVPPPPARPLAPPPKAAHPFWGISIVLVVVVGIAMAWGVGVHNQGVAKRNAAAAASTRQEAERAKQSAQHTRGEMLQQQWQQLREFHRANPLDVEVTRQRGQRLLKEAAGCPVQGEIQTFLDELPFPATG